MAIRRLIHRAPAGLKLACLALLAVAVVAVRGPASALVFLAVALTAQQVARVPWHRTTRGLVPALLTALLVGAYQWWARGWAWPKGRHADRGREISAADPCYDTLSV